MEKTTKSLNDLRLKQQELGPRFNEDRTAQAIARGLLVNAEEEGVPVGPRKPSDPPSIRDWAGSMMAANVTTPDVILYKIDLLLQEFQLSD